MSYHPTSMEQLLGHPEMKLNAQHRKGMTRHEAAKVIREHYSKICWDNLELSDAIDTLLKLAEAPKVAFIYYAREP